MGEIKWHKKRNNNYILCLLALAIPCYIILLYHAFVYYDISNPYLTAAGIIPVAIITYLLGNRWMRLNPNNIFFKRFSFLLLFFPIQTIVIILHSHTDQFHSLDLKINNISVYLSTGLLFYMLGHSIRALHAKTEKAT